MLSLVAVDALQLQRRGKVCAHRSPCNDQKSAGVNAADGGCLHGCHQTQHLCTAAGFCAGNNNTCSPVQGDCNMYMWHLTPVSSYGHTLNAQCHTGLTYTLPSVSNLPFLICDILALRAECQSTRMSEIKHGRLGLYAKV